jgi:hypothetical protein
MNLCVGVCVSTAVPQVLVSHHHLCLFIDSLAALDRALPLVTIHRITASPVLFIEKSVIFWVCVPWFLSISVFHFFRFPIRPLRRSKRLSICCRVKAPLRP